MKKYFYDGYVTPEKRPEPEDYVDQTTEYDGSYSGAWHDDKYQGALSEFEESKQGVENVSFIRGNAMLNDRPNKYPYIYFKSGQTVEVEGTIIIKIL